MVGHDSPTKEERRQEARRKAADLRARQEREQRRNRIIGIGLLVVAALAIGGGIFAVVQRQSDVDANKETYADAALPGTPPDVADVTAPRTAGQASAGIPVSKQGVGVAADGGVQVDVYLDFMCPFCGLFEQLQSDEVKRLIDPQTGQDDVTVVYHVVSTQDRQSRGTHYSSRAANAASVVADQDPDRFVAFVVALMDENTQPQEGTTGLSDQEIAQVAERVGVPTAVTDQFTKTADFDGEELRTFVPWTAAVTGTLPVNPETGQRSTPTVLVDGERWNGWLTVASDGSYTIGEPLSQVVAAARAAAGDPTGGEG